MALILGLDVSTSCTGICVVDSGVTPDDKGSHILLLDRIEFKGCNTLWDKADRVRESIEEVRTFLEGVLTTRDPSWKRSGYVHRRVVLEEPLMGFRPGMSSAQTITQLMRFNGIVSYIARNIFQCEPEYISSAHARKLCGMKLQKTSIAGPQKEQVFAYMKEHDLSHVVWELKKNGKEVDWSRDACDAYVIARAASVAGVIVAPTKKSKKAPKPKKAPGNTVEPQ